MEEVHYLRSRGSGPEWTSCQPPLGRPFIWGSLGREPVSGTISHQHVIEPLHDRRGWYVSPSPRGVAGNMWGVHFMAQLVWALSFRPGGPSGGPQQSHGISQVSEHLDEVRWGRRNSHTFRRPLPDLHR